MARASKDTWSKRVQRWSDSDLSATEFASEIGVNARTLRFWKWKLGKEQGKKATGSAANKATTKRARRHPKKKMTFVEVAPPPSWTPGARLEVVLSDRVSVRVPDGFDADTLRRVLEVVGDRS